MKTQGKRISIEAVMLGVVAEGHVMEVERITNEIERLTKLATSHMEAISAITEKALQLQQEEDNITVQ